MKTYEELDRENTSLLEENISLRKIINNLELKIYMNGISVLERLHHYGVDFAKEESVTGVTIGVVGREKQFLNDAVYKHILYINNEFAKNNKEFDVNALLLKPIEENESSDVKEYDLSKNKVFICSNTPNGRTHCDKFETLTHNGLKVLKKHGNLLMSLSDFNNGLNNISLVYFGKGLFDMVDTIDNYRHLYDSCATILMTEFERLAGFKCKFKTRTSLTSSEIITIWISKVGQEDE